MEVTKGVQFVIVAGNIGIDAAVEGNEGSSQSCDESRYSSIKKTTTPEGITTTVNAAAKGFSKSEQTRPNKKKVDGVIAGVASITPAIASKSF
jgi:hypothetical protein